MTHFTREDHSVLANITPETLPNNAVALRVQEKLVSLHRELLPQMRSLHLDLHIGGMDPKRIVTLSSVASLETGGMMCIPYWRSSAQAVVAEQRMGREEITPDAVEAHRHPVIELRLTPDNLVLELVMSPHARWDQQNLAGKLTIERHRRAVYDAMRALKDNFVLGFWRGTQLEEMHLNSSQFRWSQLLDEWMSTFAPAKDWFRLGIWYEPEASSLGEATLASELLKHIRALHGVYKQILWTSDNNFVGFYKTSAKSTPY